MHLEMFVSKILAHRHLWYFKTTKILQKWLQAWMLLLHLALGLKCPSKIHLNTQCPPPDLKTYNCSGITPVFPVLGANLWSNPKLTVEKRRKKPPKKICKNGNSKEPRVKRVGTRKRKESSVRKGRNLINIR